jgi:hypothetical protein
VTIAGFVLALDPGFREHVIALIEAGTRRTLEQGRPFDTSGCLISASRGPDVSHFVLR